MKQFKAFKKKKKKGRFIKFVFLFFFFFSYIFAFNYFNKNKLKKNILKDDINYISFNISNVISTKIDNIVNKPVLLLNSNVKKANIKVTKKTTKTNKKESKVQTVQKQSISVNEKEPIIYIYNTHQTEDYSNYSVYDASFNFAKKLNDNKISTIFEEQSITTFLQDNNLKYYKSYDVSKKFIMDAKNKYPNIKYFIDFHRDSISKNKSTLVYNNKSYAKVLFIVGLDNSSYNINLDNAKRLNNIIKSKVPNISRGIMQKKGKGVNGVYNQDISGNLFLIEVGGVENTKYEVENTMNIIYDSLIEYIGGIV